VITVASQLLVLLSDIVRTSGQEQYALATLFEFQPPSWRILVKRTQSLQWITLKIGLTRVRRK
jgi:hypothetical protein